MIDVEVSVPGITLVRKTGRVVWDGDLGVLTFQAEMPLDVVETTYPGVAMFSVDQFVIAETNFVITVGPMSGPGADISTRQHVIRSAFASYATSDRPSVLARIQGMQKVVPFVDIFLDVLSLRSGDDWMSVIRHEIQARDVFLLFWSKAASESHYVEAEWRMALSENGLGRISPVPLENPKTAPPPPELSSLHFNDWTLSIANEPS
jgi:hypothetical protein